MANEEHLRILRSGVEKWNEWRSQNPVVEPDLTNANLRLINLHGANLTDANLSNADLTGVLFIDTLLHFSVLTKATLSYARMAQLNLTSVDMSHANLSGASLLNVNFFGTNLVGCNFTDVNLGWCSFSDTLLVGILGLDKVSHDGPSSIGVDTLEQTAVACSEDDDKDDQKRIETFLERAGVSQGSIGFFRSRIGQPIQLYSAFISHSTKDQEFADRLHVDLRQKGVRCWLATEDLKIGDKLLQSINDAIRQHDKLIVVLTETSVDSTWVEDEIEMAFEKERKQGGTVLFPIRLDDTVMFSTLGWAAKVRNRQIGDFRKWKDPDEYQKALARLIRDLQPEKAWS
jgi:hypothetical protein